MKTLVGMLASALFMAFLVSAQENAQAGQGPFIAHVRELKGICYVRENEKERSLTREDKFHAGQRLSCESQAVLKIFFEQSGYVKQITQNLPKWYTLPNVPRITPPIMALGGEKAESTEDGKPVIHPIRDKTKAQIANNATPDPITNRRGKQADVERAEDEIWTAVRAANQGDLRANWSELLSFGTRLSLWLTSRIDSKQSRVGDRFTSKVTMPSPYEGAIIEGHIARLISSRRVTGRTEMVLAFDSIRLPDGRSTDLTASLEKIIDSESVKEVDEEGNVKTGSRTSDSNRRGAVGSAVGAAIGSIAGGVKGAAVGAAIGDATGVGTVYIEGNRELILEPGTEIIIRTDRARNESLIAAQEANRQAVGRGIIERMRRNGINRLLGEYLEPSLIFCELELLGFYNDQNEAAIREVIAQGFYATLADSLKVDMEQWLQGMLENGRRYSDLKDYDVHVVSSRLVYVTYTVVVHSSSFFGELDFSLRAFSVWNLRDGDWTIIYHAEHRTET